MLEPRWRREGPGDPCECGERYFELLGAAPSPLDCPKRLSPFRPPRTRYGCNAARAQECSTARDTHRYPVVRKCHQSKCPQGMSSIQDRETYPGNGPRVRSFVILKERTRFRAEGQTTSRKDCADTRASISLAIPIESTLHHSECQVRFRARIQRPPHPELGFADRDSRVLDGSDSSAPKSAMIQICENLTQVYLHLRSSRLTLGSTWFATLADW